MSVLEQSRLVKSKKRGRVRTYEIAPARFKVAEDWLTGQRRLWETRLDRFDEYIKHLKEKEDEIMSKPFTTNPKLDLVFERVIDAPKRLVWEALTKPEHLKEWYMPKPWGRVTNCEMDRATRRHLPYRHRVDGRSGASQRRLYSWKPFQWSG